VLGMRGANGLGAGFQFSGRCAPQSLCENLVRAVIPIPQSRERNLALSVFNGSAHAGRLTGTPKR